MPLLDRVLSTLKKVPIDLGQGTMRDRTRGKDIALSLVPDGRGRTALDVGCREGVQTRRLERLGYEVTAIDLASEFPGARAVNVDEGLPFPDASYDLVWSSEVIEHLVDPAASLREFRRVLKPGGKMILTTPNSFAWFFRLASALGLPPRRLQHPGHLHFFCLADVRRMCPDAAVYGYFPYLWLKRTLANGSRSLGLLTPTFVIEEVAVTRSTR